MAFSLSPSVETNEIDLSLGIANLPSAKTGMVLCSDTGPCNKITEITNESDLTKKFGKPTTGNYKDWFNAWNFLQYASSLYVVRPTNTDTVTNSGIKLNWHTTPVADDYIGQTNLYNSDIAELTLQDDVSFTDSSLYFFNKNVTSNQDLALAVCSTSEYYNLPIANEFYGITTFDAVADTWSTVNDIGGFDSTTTQLLDVNLNPGNTLRPSSQFIANGKVFTVKNVYTDHITLNTHIHDYELANWKGKIKESITVSDTDTTIDVVFSTDNFGLVVGNVIYAGGFCWKISEITSNATDYTATLLKIDTTGSIAQGTVKTSTGTIAADATTANIVFETTGFGLQEDQVLTLGGIDWTITTIVSNVTDYTITIVPVPASGTQTSFSVSSATVLSSSSQDTTLTATNFVLSNTLYSALELSSDYFASAKYTVPVDTTVIKVEPNFSFKVGDKLKFEVSAGKYIGLLADTVVGEETSSSDDTYEIIVADSINNLITLDKKLNLPIEVSAALLDDIVSIAPAIRGINYYSTVFDTSLITKSVQTVSDALTGSAVSVVIESLSTFDKYSEYPPDWTNGEFLVVILKKNSLGKYEFVEKQLVSYNETARDNQNKNIFAEPVFFNSSDYVYCKVGGTRSLVDTGDFSLVKFQNVTDSVYPYVVGSPTIFDPNGYTQADIQNAFALFADAEAFDVNILIAHEKAINEASTISETRKDCITIVAPYDYSALVSKSPTDATSYLTSKYGTQTPIAIDGFNTFGTYSAVYGNMKYQYDKFNDLNRWVSMAGDIAGIYAYTDNVRDPWYAPAGLERGKIKNAIKIAFNANKQNRDELYVNSINPIISIQGEGVAVVYGQKTATAKPSALDRVNVRRLLIVIEKAMSASVKYGLFEFNDAFTRARLKGMLDPYLRMVQARRGIIDFLVVADESNNTPSIIDANALVIDVYIKPSKSTEFIKLNVNITKSDAVFSELVGSGSF